MNQYKRCRRCKKNKRYQQFNVLRTVKILNKTRKVYFHNCKYCEIRGKMLFQL